VVLSAFVFFVVNVFTMFCPKCGSNQGEGKKFCTSCGTNLLIVSQALSGKLPQSNPLPPTNYTLEHHRQRELTKGLYFAIIGGGIIAGKLIGFIFTGFRSGFGFWGFVGFVLLAIGIARIISYRPHGNAPAEATPPPQAYSEPHQSNVQTAPPQPVFSTSSADDYVAPRTSELEPVDNPKASITEAETQNLPRHSPPPEFQR
jgi:predicted lipid-binding transport protein (Tim44 family)